MTRDDRQQVPPDQGDGGNSPEDTPVFDASYWNLRADTIYLNHGSFGPPPECVRQARAEWQRRLDEQPMDFYLRQYEPAWLAARERLAQFVGTSAENLVLVDNATVAMNAVADSVPLRPGDQVLLTDHEYGAVLRIWQRACRRAGSEPPRIARLPQPLTSTTDVVDALLAEATPATRLIVVSHITSATAVILPVAEICQAARQRGIAVCIDGPHALLQTPVALDQLQCDYYTASCHKWLCAPLGSGFLYVAPRHQASVAPSVLSWGRGPGELHRDWSDEFIWSGTGDPSAHLTVGTAIDLFERLGVEQFRARSHRLARYARQQLLPLADRPPLVEDSPDWYGSMAQVPLPRVDRQQLQSRLWQRHGIEVPIIDWDGQSFIRVSCHLYNTTWQIDRLVAALREELRGVV